MIRRIVTAQNGSASVIASDGPPPLSRAFTATPGFEMSIIWASDPSTTVPLAADEDPIAGFSRLVPRPGETRLMSVTLPPDAVMTDPGWNPMAAAAENTEHLYGLADHFEPEAPGMHRTDTLDYGVLLEGEVWLEVDGGAMTRLEPGAVIVQGGVRHAWRNRSTAAATLLFVLIGAHRR